MAVGLAPLLWGAGASFLPSLLSKLFGGNSQEELMRKIAALQSPGNLAKLTGGYYQQNIGSPAYQGALGTIAAGANASAGNVARRMGASGMTGTGTGAILSSLTPSIVGSQRAGLKTQAWDSAQETAQQAIQRQIQALIGGYGQPSQTQQLFGAGTSAFGPLLAAWLKAKYPGMFAGTADPKFGG